MGLKSIFQKAAKTAFKVADDVKIEVIFKSVVDNGIDDPEINQNPVDAIRMEFEAIDYRELSFKSLIQPYDYKLIILQENLPSVDTNDKILIDNIEYSIVGFDKDPADVTWIIGIR